MKKIIVAIALILFSSTAYCKLNKCVIGNKTAYQATKCPLAATAKVIEPASQQPLTLDEQILEVDTKIAAVRKEFDAKTTAAILAKQPHAELEKQKAGLLLPLLNKKAELHTAKVLIIDKKLIDSAKEAENRRKLLAK